ncbi:LysM peptidoglycan-binding domain-containing protein [Streptomyces sp. TRM 70351]|uniref:LysM peptidoglycan-binding domain-containing protein n=1 Tax=Streptomyces sp. TRM 70351 TaxID=3116552 RepID=UPI002E7B2160|nr:LysM peptidoglycan-binding domain-containing protein [Streptomyces sp. TRM 70351]MEE1926729.1 LysM peptidoglycan-binding domain-containing protein [Streptomyces sp. TRM 70351]
MSRGRHSRPRHQLVLRHVSRASAILALGGASVAVPLATAGSAAAAPAAAPAAAVAAAAPSQAAQQSAASHTVASGETLHGIAAAHGVEGGWEALHEANREVIGADPDLIRPGQELVLTAPDARADEARASRTAERTAAPAATAATAAAKSYPDSLDGWITEALDIMAAHGIPGSYDGIHRNIMRESSGNPNAINNWDINAQNGVPSIGLLQVIKPTFDAYHVPGTVNSQYDPVANIVAACNYAADRYGSIDNVNGPY